MGIFQRIDRKCKQWRSRISMKLRGMVDNVYFREHALPHRKRQKKVIFYTAVWGDYLDTYFSYTLPSLLQEGNIPRAKEDGYELEVILSTTKTGANRISDTYSAALDRLKTFAMVDIHTYEEFENGQKVDIAFEALLCQMKMSIEENATFFLSQPDSIVGDGSLVNGLKMIEGKDVCLAAAHPRVDMDFIKGLQIMNDLKDGKRTVSNGELVDLVFSSQPNRIGAFFDTNDANATHLGISVRPISQGHYAVIHNLPNVWLANLKQRDLRFFQLNRGLGFWDKKWLRNLLRENRVKIVGSSDLFFIAEMTSREQHRDEVKPGQLYNDRYQTRKHRHLQQYVSNSFVCSWRGSNRKENA